MTQSTNDNMHDEIRELERRLDDLKRSADEGGGGEGGDFEGGGQAPPPSNPYLVPGAIVLAGIVIAATIVFMQRGAQPAQPAGADPSDPVQPPPPAQQVPRPANVAPVTESDRILGSPDAPLRFIEFSDYNCPFCQRFHPVLKRVYQEYGANVAVVYRHFPVLGDDSSYKAHAAECVAELGGSDAFWRFTDLLFSDRHFRAPAAQLASIAVEAGVDAAAFQSCADSDRHMQRIQTQSADAVNSGGRGTPYTVILLPDGTAEAISGAAEFDQLRPVLDSILQ